MFREDVRVSGDDVLIRPRNNWALFLDLDGTLIDIAARPDRVVVPAELPGLLEACRLAFGGALAIVSGRTIADLDRLLSPLRLPVAGEHGGTLRLASDETGWAPKVPHVPSRWREAMHAFAAEHPGVVVEDKDLGAAVHYRLAPRHAPFLLELLTGLVAQLPDDFKILQAKMAYEIQPRAINKGHAVRTFLAVPPFTGRTPVFIGDDVTDEEGFHAARAVGGLGLSVDGCFDGSTAAVRAWLGDLLKGKAVVRSSAWRNSTSE